MSKKKPIQPAALPATGGSFIQGADGKLVPNTDATVTRPHPGKSVLAAEDAAKRKRNTDLLTSPEPGDVAHTATGEE